MIKTISILGCGWLGYPLAIELVKNGFIVKGSTTSSNKVDLFKSKKIKPFLININQDTGDKDFFNTDCIIIAIPPRQKLKDNSTYFENIKRIIKSVNSSCNIIYISSTSVYQNSNSVVTENTVPQPETQSGNILLNTENYLTEHFKNTTILRLSGLVGPNRHPGLFLANKTNIKNGKAPINLIHLDDCIGLIKSIIQLKIWGEIINGCSDNHTTKEEFYTKASIIINETPPTFLKSESIAYKIISNQKSKTLLNYTYKHSNLEVYD